MLQAIPLDDVTAIPRPPGVPELGPRKCAFEEDDAVRIRFRPCCCAGLVHVSVAAYPCGNRLAGAGTWV